MNNRTRKIFLIFGFILLTIFGVIRLYFQESDLPAEGALEMPSLHADVEVLTDSTGYCHFYAENNQDLYKAMGYVHASGHLPQMDNYLRAATGTLSEVYGEATLEIDIFSRTMGFAANAERFYPRLDPEVTEVLQAYCDGINIYIDQHRFRLPREFKWRRYSPAPWKPADCLAVYRMLAWLFSDQALQKVVFYKLLEVYGNTKVMDGFPAIQNCPPDSFPKYNTRFFKILNDFTRRNTQLLDFLGITPENLENSWVFSSKYFSDSGSALSGRLPAFLSNYHEIQELVSPDLNVAGMVVPGIPFILFGHNSSTAWNVIIRPVDNMEFILLPVSEDNSSYQYKNQWLPFETQKDDLFIHGADDSTIMIQATLLGPVIGHSSAEKNSPGYCIAVKWKGAEFSDDFKGLYLLNHCSSWDMFKEAVGQHVIPAIEVDYIDTAENIGTAQYFSDLVVNPLAERLSTLSRIHEPGFVSPVSHLFRNYNPKSGMIRHQHIYPDSLFQIALSRYDVFGQDTLLSYNDLISYNEHPLNRQAELILPLFFEIVADSDLSTSQQQKAFDILKTWNYRMSPESIAATIFDAFILQLRRLVYQDEMDLADPGLFAQFDRLTDESFVNMLYLLSGEESSWFDDIRTSDIVERRKTIVLKAYRETLDYLSTTFSSNISEWTCRNISEQSRLEQSGLDQVVFLVNLIPQPAIRLFNWEIMKTSPLFRSARFHFRRNTFHSGDRFALMQNGAQVLTLTPK
ncbi:MAG: penicillin acylase family protein [Candidatus Marinimicrobia bacterium]|nr:penicillin acylase family protein [Candidatus Neomarinimicrobiota bacterium]